MMKRLLFVAVLLATRLLGANADVDPNFYIYICFGQSNMEGNAQWETMDNTVDTRFQLLATCNFSSPSRTKGKWYKATPPLVSPAGKLGPTDYFGRTMVAALPAGVKVGVIPVAMGGSPIEMFDKDKYQQKLQQNPNEWWATLAKQHYGGNPYGRIIEMAKKAQEVGVIKGILLHQGCSNCGDPNWPNMVKKIYNDMLADLGLKAADVPLFVGEVEYQGAGTNKDSGGCASHNVQVARIPSVIPTGHVVSAAGVPGNNSDPWHFSALGYRILGKRYALEALKVMGVEQKPDAQYSMPQALKKFYGAKSLAVATGDFIIPGEPVAVTATFNDNHKEDVSDYVTIRSNDILIQDGKISSEGEGTIEIAYTDFCNQVVTASQKVHATFFPFDENFLMKRSGTVTVDIASRTITFSSNGSQAGWQYEKNVDWSAYKYLVVKLKEAIDTEEEIRIYKKTTSSYMLGYKEAIGNRTVVAIDLKNMVYSNKTMDPSSIGKMIIYSPKKGTVILDEVFLSNDESFANHTTAIREMNTASPFRAPLYSLDGRLADPEALKPGIYIRDGKKIVVR